MIIMPAKSKAQKKLFTYAYACKKGYAKNCPDKVAKIGQSMSAKQLRDFFEGIIYKTSKANKDSLINFLVWMDSRNIEYIYDEESDELEVYNEFSLSRDDDEMLLQYASKLGLKKIWEKGEYLVEDGEGGTTSSNLANTIGQGSVRPPAGTTSGSGGVELRGSGDRFDSFDEFDDEDDDNDEKKRLKKKKKKAAQDRQKRKKEAETEEHKNKQNGVTKESIYMNIETFINEDVLLISERLTAKRKYTDNHPSINVNYSAPIRNKVLSFVSDKKQVSEEEMKEFFGTLKEESGKRANWNWISKNSDLVKKFESDGKTFYKLTKRGNTILQRCKDFENKNNNLK